MLCDKKIVEQQKQIHVLSYLVKSLSLNLW